MKSLYPLSKLAQPDANSVQTIESPTWVSEHEFLNQSAGHGGVLHSPPNGLNIGTAAGAGTDYNIPFDYSESSMGDGFSGLGHAFSGNMHVGSQHTYPYAVRKHRHEISTRG